MKQMLGYRKFSITLLCFLFLTTFLLTGHIQGTDYAKSLSAVVVAFNGANLIEHLSGVAKEYFNKSINKGDK